MEGVQAQGEPAALDKEKRRREVIAVILVVLAIIGTVFAIEATDKGSRLWQKRWCKRHGLTMREQVTALGYGATLWWGEDADGNGYVPDADGTPVCIRPTQEGGAA